MALLGVTAIRFALMAAGVAAAVAVGASGRAALIGCGLGLLGGALFVLADPRRKLFAEQAPDLSRPWWERALRATYPSTIGLAVLCGIALAFNGVLAAVLAGIIGGLGVGVLIIFLGWPALLLAVALGLAAGCGGKSARLTKAQLIARGDKICTALHSKNVALQRRAPRIAPTNPTASDREVRAAGPILVELADNLRSAREAFSRLTPPAGVAERYRRALRQFGDIAAALDRAGHAAKALDRQGVIDGYDRALRVNASLQQFQRDYGFKICGRSQ